MKINPDSYPYPFLSEENDNYINSDFNAETTGVQLNQETNQFEIDIEIDLKNELIEEMLEIGELSLQIHVDCPDTYYNEVFEVINKKMRIPVEKKKIAGKVELNVLLVVEKEIINYTNKDFHPDFSEMSFNFTSGNLLGGAFAGEVTIENKIPEKVEAIFKIVSDSKVAPGEFNANYNKNKIYIYLSETDHYNVQRLLSSEKTNPLLYSLLIIPVLVDALYYMRETLTFGYDAAEMKQLDWYKSIEEKLNDLDISIEDGNDILDPLVTASNLIENPLQDALLFLLESSEENE